jgi:hypothetical protein
MVGVRVRVRVGVRVRLRIRKIQIYRQHKIQHSGILVCRTS